MLGMVRALLLFLLLLVLARALLRFFGGIVQGATAARGSAGPHRPAAPPATKMARDPVCGTYVVPGKALEWAHGRDTMFFCSETCRKKFIEKT